MTATLPSWRTAWGPPVLRALWRQQAEDFRVDEQLSFTPDGSGPHLYLRLEKRGLDTARVVRHLARCAGLPQREIGYAGRKDRHAVTTQWFSLPVAELPADLEIDSGPASLRLLEHSRNARKLRRGALRGNQFALRLRAVERLGDLEARLQQLATQGLPNYFGPQRFGRDGGNLVAGRAWLRGERRVRGRDLQGLYLSALRSLLFNQVLSARIADGSWNQLKNGDILQLNGSRSQFVADPGDAALPARIAAGDLHPTGPLPGRGGPQAPVRDWEQARLADEVELLNALADRGLQHDRRALRVLPEQLCCDDDDGQALWLRFGLPAGAYATALLRELLGADLGESDAQGSGASANQRQPGERAEHEVPMAARAES